MPGVDTSKFAKRINLANFKSEVEELDVDELKIDPVVFRKPSDVVNNDVAKKTVYDELVRKDKAVDAVDVDKLVKAACNTKTEEIEKKFLIMMNASLLMKLVNLLVNFLIKNKKNQI